MDCNTARLLLAFVRPSNPTETDAAEAEALQQHLDGCAACAALAHDERRADDRFSRAMQAVKVPSGLRERLLVRLDAEREAWRRGWGKVAAAAVLLLTIGLGLGYVLWAPRVPDVDLPAVAQAANRAPTTDKQVEEAFKEEFKVQMKAPEDLNYRLLEGYHLALFQGQPVPYLVFAFNRPNESAQVAHVYVLSVNQFNKKSALEFAGNLRSGRFSISVHDMDNPYFYIMIYSGNRDDFKKPKPRARLT